MTNRANATERVQIHEEDATKSSSSTSRMCIHQQEEKKKQHTRDKNDNATQIKRNSTKRMQHN